MVASSSPETMLCRRQTAHTCPRLNWLIIPYRPMWVGNNGVQGLGQKRKNCKNVAVFPCGSFTITYYNAAIDDVELHEVIDSDAWRSGYVVAPIRTKSVQLDISLCRSQNKLVQSKKYNSVYSQNREKNIN